MSYCVGVKRKLIDRLPPSMGKRYEIRDALIPDLHLRVSAKHNDPDSHMNPTRSVKDLRKRPDARSAPSSHFEPKLLDFRERIDVRLARLQKE